MADHAGTGPPRRSRTRRPAAAARRTRSSMLSSAGGVFTGFVAITLAIAATLFARRDA